MLLRTSLLAAAIATIATPAFADTVVTFDNGAEGWVGPTGSGGATTIDQTGGNPGANMHTLFRDFGITFRTTTNEEFVRDYSILDAFTIAVDVKVESIAPFEGGQQTFRPWVVELRDYDNPPEGYPWVSVFFEYEWISQSDWTTWSVTVDDPSATDLPEGWGGFGAEDEFGAPMLPADRTFADVLAGVDEVVFTTLEPGWFFTMDNYDVRIDNITIETSQSGGCDQDLDGDGMVGFSDILEILTNWGPCP